VSESQKDLGDLFFEALIEKTGTLSLTFLDAGTKGVLSERLIGLLKTENGRKLSDRVEIMTRYSDASSAEQLPPMAHEWIFGVFSGNQIAVLGPNGRNIETITTPYSNPLLADRAIRYQVEMAFKIWKDALT